MLSVMRRFFPIRTVSIYSGMHSAAGNSHASPFRRFRIFVYAPLLVAVIWMREAICASIAELPPESAIASEYVMSSWHTEDGLPENTITCIAQGADGYIWFGTFHGLARFDGVRFTVFDESNTPGIGRDGIAQIVPDREGWVWMIRQSGG